MLKMIPMLKIRRPPQAQFSIKMMSYQNRKSHCGDKTILGPSYLHNGISYTGKTTSLCWIRALLSSPKSNIFNCHHLHHLIMEKWQSRNSPPCQLQNKQDTSWLVDLFKAHNWNLVKIITALNAMAITVATNLNMSHYLHSTCKMWLDKITTF